MVSVLPEVSSKLEAEPGSDIMPIWFPNPALNQEIEWAAPPCIILTKASVIKASVIKKSTRS